VKKKIENKPISKYLRWTDYERRNDKLLIACLSFNRDNLPYDDETFDLWTMNGGWALPAKFDLCFDMHNWGISEYTIPYCEDLKTKDIGCPLVVPQYNLDILSKQILYPREEIIKLAGMNFRNSIPEMIMFAMLLRYKYVFIGGIDSEEFDKYPDMGHSLYYSIGFARATGMKIYLLNDYKMDDQYFYGYQVMKNKDIRQ
jgi:hypothetical protein